ncbi:LIM-domain binding protein-domain-containing protein [Cercophora scortea]|uniref:LIM-domain binding protein-domain-containing protein n=1 Tax=Cercophora scortea TaxID=314031 RepID=A0AAE0IA83_9PEZI|nr:LIM-domain binding protein-domain-containing protein [Cercophora scortea]
MAHNPSQPGATPGGMPHQLVGHMGVSGPGGQINAALMAGMPPGAGNPNAHAMQHLNPSQAQLFHHQQQMNNPMFANAAGNPQQLHQAQMQQQHRLAQLQQQQQARQVLMQQQAYQNIGNMPMGIPINATQAAQYQQMRNQMARIPPHLAQQQPGQPMNALMAQQMAIQHQQQQMNQMQQNGNPNQHPLNPNPQQLSLQQAQQIQAIQQQHAQAQAAQAAQHAQAQQGQGQQQQNQQQQAQQAQQQAHQQQAQQQQAQQQQAQHQQAQQQAQQQQQAQAQQAQQQQAQQQQAQQQQGQPQGQPQQQQTPQQQQGQGAPGANGPAPNQGGPAQNPTPQPNPQQQPQAPPQQQQQPQTSQAHQVHQAQMVHAQQAHQAGVANMMLQQKREGVNLKGVCLLKLMQFSEHLSGFPGSKGKDDLGYWNEFVHRFFSHKGIFRHTILVRENDEAQEKQYEIAYPALARYFHTHFDSGVKTMQLIMEKGTTDKALPNDCHFIENNKASLVYWYEDNSHVVANGTLRAQFDNEQKFELFEFVTTNHEEYISRRSVIQAARPQHNWVKEWRNLNQQDTKASPEMSKKGKARPPKSPPGPPPDIDLPDSFTKSGMGITEAVYQFLEIVEIIGQMNPLFGYYHSHPGLAPYAALEQYVNQVSGPAAGHVNGQPIPQGGPRTPNFGGQFPVGASPAMANQILPASPHMGSPAPGHIQAPGMQLQASQQGTSSSGPSANTSPSQNNKRRRASAVKEEDTPASAPTPAAAGTPQLNGVQPKAKPPTPRMQKRQKGNPPA